MDINEILNVVQTQIPAITVGVGLVGNMIGNFVKSKKKDLVITNQKDEIVQLNGRIGEVEKTLNDVKNSKAILKIARQHEDRLSRLENTYEKEENKII